MRKLISATTLVAILALSTVLANAAVREWSTTAADNDDADGTISWLEGQAPSSVNDSARAVMAAIKSWFDLIDQGTVSNCTVGGTAAAVTLTCSPTVAARGAGQRYLFKLGSATTGATTLNIDGLGAAAIQYRAAALVANDYAANDWILVTDDGTVYQSLTPPRVAQVSVPATQAQQETGTSTAVNVTPGRQHFHQSAAKAWVSFVPRGTNGAATLSASYNISGVSRTAAGVYAISFTTAQSATTFACLGTANDSSANNLLVVSTAKATGSCTIKQMSASTAAGSDLGDTIDVVVYGDL